MARRTHVWLGLGACLLGGGGCFQEPEPYFGDQAAGPVLEEVTRLDVEGVATARDLQGGVTLRIKGENLADASLAVRIGSRNATVLPDQAGGGGRYLTVLTPPGPVSGGWYDVTVATSRGVATLPDAMGYDLPGDDVFVDEAASIEVIGHADGSGDIRVGFWPERRPRWAGSLFPQGALYYLPEVPDQPTLWQGSSPDQVMARSDTVVVASSLRLEPLAQPDLFPVTLALDDVSGNFTSCSNGLPVFWRSGVDYELSLSGGVLEDAIDVVLTSPARVADEHGAIEGLLLDDLGVAQVDDDRNLVLQYPPDTAVTADAAFVLAELVVEVPDESLGEHRMELARVVVWGQEDEERIELTPEDLALLPPVDTDCALAARQWEAASLEGDVSAAEDWAAAYASHGCMEDPSPATLYPRMGYVRLSRHHIHRVPLPPGVAGCATPGACPGEAVLIVDLVAAQEVPAAFGPLPDCEDLVDNDGDGLVDGEDPGCNPNEQDDSEIDDTGAYPCDNGVDDDGDGLIDYAVGEGGDPGCTSPSDPDEISPDFPCDNGVDDDRDGVADYRPGSVLGDPGCTSVMDSGEREDGLQCDDGQDNDGDGGVDYSPTGTGDQGCDSPADVSEYGTTACDNGLDDDQDGYIDYRIQVGVGDPGCSGPGDDSEKYQPGVGDDVNAFPCDDGQDNDVDGWIDGEDPGCRTIPARQDTYDPYEADEHNPDAECDDDIDNDGDGYKDYRTDGQGDPECLTAIDDSEDRK